MSDQTLPVGVVGGSARVRAVLERAIKAADAIKAWREDDSRGSVCIEEACEAEEALRDAADLLRAEAAPSSFGNEDLVWRIELFRESDGRFACDFQSGDSRVGGMSDYSSTPVGALAELCATLLKIDEDEASEHRAVAGEAAPSPQERTPPPEKPDATVL